MQQFNLTRIDQRFAVETELFDVFRFVNKAFFVIGVGIDGVERRNTGCTGSL